MLYAHIKGNKVEKITGKPKWFFDDGTQVDDTYLKNEGVYPIDLTEDTTKENMYYTKDINTLNDLVIDEVNKVVKNYYKYTPIPLEQLLEKVYQEKRNEVVSKRDAMIFSDFGYTFPSGEGIVQLRNEIDLRNIQVNGVSALSDVVAGNASKVHHFMDGGNVLREMSAQQMLDMSNFAKDRAQVFYSVSWQKKHVDLKGIYDGVGSVQEKIEGLLAYDVNTGWVNEPE